MSQSATLDEFIYLNKELAGLARAGMPIDRGLAMLGAESPGRAGRMASQIAERVKAGTPLAEAVADGQTPLPELYRSVVEAGVRSGRLAEALENLAESADRVARLRSATMLAMLYPLCLFLLAYGMGALMFLYVVPDMMLTIELMGSQPPWLSAALADLARRLGWWLVLPPVIVLLWFAAWCYGSGRARGLLAGRFGRSRGVLQRSRLAILCELIALMTSHGVPLGKAVTLAADGTGDRRMIDAAGHWAAAWQQGRLDAKPLREAGFPPLIAWLLASGSEQAALSTLFRQASRTYERQAERAAYWRTFTLPTIFTGLIGGSIVVGYGVMFFMPWMSMLHRLSLPV